MCVVYKRSEKALGQLQGHGENSECSVSGEHRPETVMSLLGEGSQCPLSPRRKAELVTGHKVQVTEEGEVGPVI